MRIAGRASLASLVACSVAVACSSAGNSVTPTHSITSTTPVQSGGAAPPGIPLIGTPEGRAAIVQFRPVTAVVERSDPSWGQTNVSCGGADPCSADQLEHAATITVLSADGGTKYVLRGVFATGADLTSLGVIASNGNDPAVGWEVTFRLGSAGTAALLEATTQALTAPPPLNEIAIVVDGVVVSAPIVQAPISQGAGVIAVAPTRSEATALATRIGQAGS